MRPAAFPRQSLKTRITLTTLGMFLIGMWSLAFYGSRMLREDMQHLLAEQQLSVVSMVAEEVNHELDDRLRALERAAGRITPAMMNNRPGLQTFLEDRPILQHEFNGGIAIMDVEGTVIADVPLSAERIGVNYMDVDVASAVALREGKSSIGRPVMGKKLRAPVFVMVVPIRDAQAKVIGALAGVINLGKPNFLDIITQGRYGETGGYLLLAPRHRVIVSATDKSRIMEPMPAHGSSPWVDRISQGYEGSDIFVNPRGVEVLTSVKGIPAAAWIMVVATPTADAFAPIRVMQQRMLLATIVLTLLAGGITWWLLRRQFMPLQLAVNNLAALTAANQPPQPLPILRQDEIGELIGGFNRLLDMLRQREKLIQEGQENLAITLNSIGDAVIATDRDGRITRMNPVAERLTGWAFADTRDRPLAEVFRIVDANTREATTDPVRLVMAHGDVVELANHTLLLARDGREYQIADSAAPIRDAGGEILGVVLVFSDISEKHRVREALRESEERYRTAFMTSPDAININRLSDGMYLDVNNGFSVMSGWNRDEVIGKTSREINIWRNIEDRQRLVAALQRDGHCENLEADFVARNGRVIAGLMSAHVISLQGEQCILSMTRDITERKQAEASLRIAATAFESQEGIFITDADRIIVRVNQAFSDITGYKAADAIGQTPKLLSSGRHDAAFYQAMEDSIGRSGGWQGEIWNRRKNGEVYPEWLTITAVKNAQGAITHYVSTLTDITSRKTAEDEIRNLAFYDPLTRLPNRRLLLDRLQQALASASRSARHGALLFIDLDNFKTLNDTLGHDIGDLLLQQVAQRLATCVREGDSIARLGGDEFVVMLEDLSENPGEAATQAEAVGEKIIFSLDQPYQLASYEQHNTPSIGIALFSNHRETIDELLKWADLAMYQAKAAGRNTLRFYDPEMQAVVKARAALELELRKAIVEHQFVVYYQAQVDSSGIVTGAEALVRWRHPERGLVSPTEFIPLAEDTGLILPLGQAVLAIACAQLAAWASQPAMAHLTLAVNVSARQFRLPNFVDQVLAALANAGARPDKLKLELTESLLLENAEDVISKMAVLKARGVSFSLDDFGTGYSSLSYLKRLPLDQLKIDQSFVRDILTDTNDAVIARSVVALGQSLGLGVIAEGVETEGQRSFLASHGCLAFQGYLFSQPLPVAGFESLVRQG